MTDDWLWVVPCPDVHRVARFFLPFRVPGEDVLIIDNTSHGFSADGKVVFAGEEYAAVGGTRLNHGCARSWNIGRRACLEMRKPGVVLASPSLVWGEQGGQDLHSALRSFPTLGRPFGVRTNADWHLICWDALALERIGTWDERIYPVYFEDNDWNRRVALDGSVVMYDLEIDVEMGQTGQSIAEVQRCLDLPHLQAYYEEKWGPVGAETYSTPFGLPVPTSWWPGHDYAGQLGMPPDAKA